MAFLVERERLPFFRLAKPNRDHYQGAHPHAGKTVAPEEDPHKHIKQADIREVPTVHEVIRAAEGVNSRSAEVLPGFVEAARASI